MHVPNRLVEGLDPCVSGQVLPPRASHHRSGDPPNRVERESPLARDLWVVARQHASHTRHQRGEVGHVLELQLREVCHRSACRLGSSRHLDETRLGGDLSRRVVTREEHRRVRVILGRPDLRCQPAVGAQEHPQGRESLGDLRTAHTVHGGRARAAASSAVAPHRRLVGDSAATIEATCEGFDASLARALAQLGASLIAARTRQRARARRSAVRILRCRRRIVSPALINRTELSPLSEAGRCEASALRATVTSGAASRTTRVARERLAGHRESTTTARWTGARTLKRARGSPPLLACRACAGASAVSPVAADWTLVVIIITEVRLIELVAQSRDSALMAGRAAARTGVQAARGEQLAQLRNLDLSCAEVEPNRATRSRMAGGHRHTILREMVTQPERTDLGQKRSTALSEAAASSGSCSSLEREDISPRPREAVAASRPHA
eukprot:7385025-Prymnesium_polylepis.6